MAAVEKNGKGSSSSRPQADLQETLSYVKGMLEDIERQLPGNTATDARTTVDRPRRDETVTEIVDAIAEQLSFLNTDVRTAGEHVDRLLGRQEMGEKNPGGEPSEPRPDDIHSRLKQILAFIGQVRQRQGNVIERLAYGL